MNNILRSIIAFTCAFFIYTSKPLAKNAPEKPFTVVIDPGHGGKDPGASYRTLIKEKDVVLQIGLKLGEYIRRYLSGVKVIFTRDRDVFVPLHVRAEIANKNKADLFISLHANYCGAPSISGAETFVLGLHRSEENLDVAKKENSVILMEDDYSSHYEGFDPNSPESYIMFEMVQDEYLDQSIDFAAEVQNQFRDRIKRTDRGVKQAGFLVLRRTSMPSVLIESGFLSNPTEAQYMNSTVGQEYLASAIFRAVRSYKNTIESKSEYKMAAPVQQKKEINPVSIKSPPAIAPIMFRIQLAATSKKIVPIPANFKGLQNIDRKRSRSTYKYYYGNSASFDEIQKLKAQVKALFPDAFVVAFEKGEAISLKKALRKIKP